MLRQLTPLVRFDGYHVLADVTGVPDLFHRIKPTLLGVLPWRWGDPEATAAQAVGASGRHPVGASLVVPLLVFSLVCMVLDPAAASSAPRGRAPASRVALLGDAWSDGDFLEVDRPGLAVIAVVFPVLADRRSCWSGSCGSVVDAHLAARPAGARSGGRSPRLLALALVAGLAYVWWPRDGRLPARSSPTRAARSPRSAAAPRPRHAPG